MENKKEIHKFSEKMEENTFQDVVEFSIWFWGVVDESIKRITKNLIRDKEIKNSEMTQIHIQQIYSTLKSIKKFLWIMMNKMRNMTSKQSSKMNYLNTLAKERIRIDSVIFEFKSFCNDMWITQLNFQEFDEIERIWRQLEEKDKEIESLTKRNNNQQESIEYISKTGQEESINDEDEIEDDETPSWLNQ